MTNVNDTIAVIFLCALMVAWLTFVIRGSTKAGMACNKDKYNFVSVTAAIHDKSRAL